MKSLEGLAKSISRHPKATTVKAVAPRVALHVEKHCGPFKGSSFLSKSDGGKTKQDGKLLPDQVVSMPIEQEYSGMKEVSISVPVQNRDQQSEGTSCKRPVGMVFSIFQGDELFQKAGGRKDADKKVNGRIISASAFQPSESGSDEKAQLSDDVEMTFSPFSVSCAPTCVQKKKEFSSSIFDLWLVQK